jgi:pimeloyl-ACP methyl ester carboxylesterase
MRREEITEAGRLAGIAMSGPGAFARQLHEAIARRAFEAVGPAATPVRVAHDAIAERVHAGVGEAIQRGTRGAAALLARTAPAEAPPLAASPGGSLALAALNAAWGDALSGRRSPLALDMTLRRRGTDVVPEPSAVAAACPRATGSIAIFVHGLGEDDAAWGYRSRRRGGSPSPRYGVRMERELGYTALYLRYNTGLHISDNGRALSGLLEQLVDAWPVEVREIVLIGHSMGGLVARSACHYGDARGARWIASLHHVFCLGSPHLGAPLEKGANVLGAGLALVPETRPLARALNARSAGIKDLRFGSCAEEDWCDCDPDEFLRDRCHEVPFLETATYYFVGATLSSDPQAPLGAVLGDLLVRFPSASGSGRRRRIGFEVDNGCHLGGLTHFDLLNHPAVYERIEAWLGRARTAHAASSS